MRDGRNGVQVHNAVDSRHSLQSVGEPLQKKVCDRNVAELVLTVRNLDSERHQRCGPEVLQDRLQRSEYSDGGFKASQINS